MFSPLYAPPWISRSLTKPPEKVFVPKDTLCTTQPLAPSKLIPLQIPFERIGPSQCVLSARHFVFQDSPVNLTSNEMGESGLIWCAGALRVAGAEWSRSSWGVGGEGVSSQLCEPKSLGFELQAESKRERDAQRPWALGHNVYFILGRLLTWLSLKVA